MASSIPIQIAETIQTASINQNPSAEHDINPSTAASVKEPVILTTAPQTSPPPTTNISPSSSSPDRIDIEDDSIEEDEIPVSVLRPKRRDSRLPPLPDLRFEQSYLRSLAGADTWWKVAWITARDQVMMPLVQGMVWNLGLVGWQTWNKRAQYSGSGLGARARRWWYGVNNWEIPKRRTRMGKA